MWVGVFKIMFNDEFTIIIIGRKHIFNGKYVIELGHCAR